MQPGSQLRADSHTANATMRLGRYLRPQLHFRASDTQCRKDADAPGRKLPSHRRDRRRPDQGKWEAIGMLARLPSHWASFISYWIIIEVKFWLKLGKSLKSAIR